MSRHTSRATGRRKGEKRPGHPRHGRPRKRKRGRKLAKHRHRSASGHTRSLEQLYRQAKRDYHDLGDQVRAAHAEKSGG